MKMDDISGKMGGLMNGKGNTSNIMDKLSIPDCDQTQEFGTRNDGGAFDTMADAKPANLEIAKVTIAAGAILDSITVTYADGVTVKHGGGGGGTIQIDLRDDTIKRVCGEYDVDFNGRRVISRLSIETGKGKKHGPYGSAGGGNQFAFGEENKHVAGFFGSAKDGYIASLGGHLMK